ncbi:hypothetical protein TNCV_4570701 [Trichonephila clavipes]|nr:hypothetical protein TNCV_4570701 [Trichonephila clavipes]
MNGKPVFLQLPSEKQILFEHYWMSFNCTPKNKESLKDSIDSAKNEPESVLETFARKRNERFKRDNPEDTGWILTREAMLDLILSVFAKPSLYVYTDHAKVLIWTDEMVWTVGKRPHPDWTLVGYLQWKCVRPQGKLVLRSFNDLILGVQHLRWVDEKGCTL